MRGKLKIGGNGDVKKVCLLMAIAIFILSMTYIIDNAETLANPMKDAILYVGGSGSNNYSKIQDAINDANNGDTIFVYNGTYYENLVINKSINLIGEERNATIIDGNNSGDVVYINADNVSISNFTIRNSGDSSPDSGIKVYYNGISNCEISYSNIFNSYYGILFYYLGNRNVVHDCEIYSNNWTGIEILYTDENIIYNCNVYSNAWWGIDVVSAKNNTIYNCNSYKNSYGGIGLAYAINTTIYNCNISSNDYSNIRFQNSYNNSIFNCKLTNCSKYSYSRSVHLYWQSGNNSIYLNSISNNTYGIYSSSNCNNNTVFYNNFVNNTVQAYDNGNNTWDNGYPMGGNYWNDFTTPDNKHGYFQNMSGFDLIVDHPYNISGGSNKDRWPHAIKNGWMKPLFVPNSLIVEFKQNVSNSTINATIANYGTEVIEYLPYVNVYLLNITADNQSEFDTLYMFQNDTNVSMASLDMYGHLLYKPEHLTSPNDQCYPKQWHLNNYGINPGVPTGLIDADIDAPQAWEHLTDCRKDWNNNSFVIAIIDTGVDLNHPDIVANLWINPNDPPGDIANDGIDNDGDGLIDWMDPDFDGDPNPFNPDDDGNGVVDDIHGADFIDRDGSPDDEDGHGTHCAGIICAHGNNGIGVTGVCWRAQLMALRGVPGSVAVFQRCINYILWAKAHGINVKVVSFSAAWSQPIIPIAIRNALQNAINRLNNAGILFVCAAGNDGRDLDNPANPWDVYPAECTNPNIITVAASDNQDRLAGFSNYGTTSVDIVAPGENILSLAMHGTYVYRDNDGDNKVSTGDRRLTSIPAIFPAGSTVRGDDTDCVEGYRIFNFDAHEKYWDKNGNNRYDAGEYIYWDGNNDNKISAGDRRLMDVYIDGELKYHHGSIVNAGDSDAENGLHSFAANERHIDLIPRNSRYEFNEDIYRDVDGNGRVSVNDIRLTTVDDESFEGNSQVQSGESDAGDCLHSFAPNEKYWDWRNNNNQFDDEFIYIDKDGNNIISIGDQRLTQVRVRVAGGVRVYSPGSFVEVGNADIGANLKPFQANEKYSLVRYMSGTSMATPMVAGEVAHFWCQFPWLNNSEVKNWVLRKVDPRRTLRNTVMSGIYNDGRLRMISGFDFGDAPDPYLGLPGLYPTVLWHELSHGASHEDIGEEWLGWDVSPEYDANVNTTPPYDVDISPNLWPSRVPPTPHPPYNVSILPDMDFYDDGVSLPTIVFVGGTYNIQFHIQTENPFINDTDHGRYDEFQANKRDSKKIYINTYFDWNCDGDWDDSGEHLVKCPAKQCTWWGGPGMTCCYGIFWSPFNLSNPLIPLLNKNAFRKTTFTVPWNACKDIWVRARLDYGENAGRPPWPRYDSHHPFIAVGEILHDTYAHAQFGEVEDYHLICVNKIKVIGEPKYNDGEMVWITSYTPIEIIDEPEPPYPVEDYYRIWYGDSWPPWMEYNETFYLEGEGMHYIEYYGEAVEENRTIFYDNFNDDSRWAAIDLDGFDYTWEWTNITPEWVDEPLEGHFMLLDQYGELEIQSHDSLVSAPISCGLFNNTMLYFNGAFKTMGNEKLWLNISSDDGGNWTNVLMLDENSTGPWIINISDIADGNIIILNFTYSSPYGTGYGALIDDVYIYGDIITYSPIYNQSHMLDDTPPVAIINGMHPYNQTSIPFEITYNASDNGCGIKEVELYFRYSYDNATWSDWMLYSKSKNGKWLFHAPYAPAYYEFYSKAIDHLNNTEGYDDIEAIAYVPIKTFTFELGEGWDFVTIPCENEYNASMLYSSIPGCNIILKWNNSKDDFDVYVPGSPCDFNIEDGIGYFVAISYNTFFAIEDVSIASVNITLLVGWNSLGWFKEEQTNASDIYNSIAGCNIVLRWNNSKNDFDVYVPNAPDFVIEQGNGFFVSVSQQSQWHGS